MFGYFDDLVEFMTAQYGTLECCVFCKGSFKIVYDDHPEAMWEIEIVFLFQNFTPGNELDAATCQKPRTHLLLCIKADDFLFGFQ